jgi:hypothetical protein
MLAYPPLRVVMRRSMSRRMSKEKEKKPASFAAAG